MSEISEVRTADGIGLITIERKTLETMDRNAEKMGQMLLQMGQMLLSVQARMDDLEAKQAAVTVSHEDVKRMNGLIRSRACELCGKYGLGVKSVAVVKKAILKEVKKRYGIADLHDLPEAKKSGAESMITGWVNIRLMMERRDADDA